MTVNHTVCTHTDSNSNGFNSNNKGQRNLHGELYSEYSIHSLLYNYILHKSTLSRERYSASWNVDTVCVSGNVSVRSKENRSSPVVVRQQLNTREISPLGQAVIIYTDFRFST